MTQVPYLVTAATGRIGAAVVRQIRGLGRPVRALVHRQDARSERLHQLGAEVVVGDLFDLVQVEAAMQGAAGV